MCALLRIFVSVLAIAASACGPEVTVTRNLSYDDRFGAATTLDVYAPANADLARAAVLIVHGGGWKQETRAAFGPFAEQLAQDGYVVGNIDYRLVPDGRFPGAVQDAHCALSFLKANASRFGVDPDRIAVFGYSAGGQIASLIAVASDREDVAPDCAHGRTTPPRAAISAAGVQDMRALAWTSEVRNYLGGTLEQVPEVYSAASPLDHVDDGEPPFLFVHGDQDVYVPASHSERMRDRLREQNNLAELVLINGGGHVINPSAGAGQLSWSDFITDSPEAVFAIRDFLERELAPR